MTRTGQAAIDYARSRIGPNAMPASGYCLQFVRQCFDVGSYYASAIDAWNASQYPHPGDRNPPPATPVYFRSPSIYDHVAFYVSPTEVISTFNADVRAFNGIAGIEANFSGQFLGWAEDINRVRIWTGGTGPGPTPPTPDTPKDDDDMVMVIQSPHRGLAVVMGHRVVPIGSTGTADGLTAAGAGRAQITDEDFDRMRMSGNNPLLVKEPSRGYALLVGTQAVGIGDMSTVDALRGIGIAEIDISSGDFTRLTTSISASIPQPPSREADQ